ncbi:hypothetical protein Pla86_38530 [Planctomycetes bacterium Pla86]|uniref:Arsenosugar biosynthesis radical SAM protein ArsS-like C-terminal domain-containing protein n=1 Tax=Engelhardtia mirabilis TaxID=2528011 RepID=A0A518BP48_9BACT|nr:hypothetical protein Pla133_38540 [Planctomycetes bacterium Pla133]QDV03078.1 hypothetical protein Pla86_38530 [Planctomycetes bacterium Pla86]
MPKSRYLQWLERSGNIEAYLQRLVDAFNPTAAAGVMCRTTLSVGWDGRLFDCDLNQMLELTMAHGAPQHIDDLDLAGDSLTTLAQRRIVTGRHCFGCTPVPQGPGGRAPTSWTSRPASPSPSFPSEVPALLAGPRRSSRLGAGIKVLWPF